MKRPITLAILISIFFLTYTSVSSQVVVFSDDFTDYTDPAWTATGNLSGSAWEVFRLGDDFGARRNDSPSQLELSNDISGTNNANGYVMVTTPTTDFTSPYNTTLSNGGVVTWTFNMRQIRTDPSGFDSNNYGVAFLLAAQASMTNETGTGYAVVLGQSGGTDPVRLARFTGGMSGNAGITNIIVSNTTGLADFGLEHLSVKVTYNPCNGGVWELFLRNDGTSFADPLSGTLVSQGTATDNTYTGTPLEMMAAYWQASTAGSQPAFFNNVTVSVVSKPSATIGSNPIICSGITSANLSYSNPIGNPNQYKINWNAAAEAQGFSDISPTALPASPIILTIPGGAAPATYSGDLTLINSTTTCESVLYPITVTINPLPVVGCPNDTTLCSDSPAYTLTGGSPTGGTYTGTGVSGGMFDPAMASPGVNVITYTYTDINLCSNTCTFDITVNTAPVAMAGSYGPACLDGPDIVLNGMPSGGTWSGDGVTGNSFDPSYGTQTLTYTYTDMNGCSDSDQTTITVSSCAAPSTMKWILLEQGSQNGTCTSNSDCDENIICYALEYTPLYTGVMTAYTTGFFMDCDNGSNPVITNTSCVMTNNSPTQNFCSQVDSVLFNSSGNTGNVPITAGVSINIHQVCFTIPSAGVMIITKDPTTGLTVAVDLSGGGFTTENVMNYDPYVVDSTSDCAILPLRWLEFTAKEDGDFITRLDWVTTDEINNSHFEVQRTNDQGYVFETIGRVEADLEARDIHTYAFTDKNARPGKNYYRIKQVDFDGRFQYSSLRTVSFAASNSFKVNVYPNPVQDYFTVRIYQPEEHGKIALVDMAGRVVLERNFDQAKEVEEVIVDQFPEGVYTLLVTSGNNMHVEKLVIID